MSHRTYITIKTTQIDAIDFNEVNENKDTLRYSVDGTKTFVKFEGDTPSFLDGKTHYTHSEILNILRGPEWTPEELEL